MINEKPKLDAKTAPILAEVGNQSKKLRRTRLGAMAIALHNRKQTVSTLFVGCPKI